MELKQVFRQIWSGKVQPHQQAVQFQHTHRKLSDVFVRFANHLNDCKTDPQFFREIVKKIDVEKVENRLLELIVLDGDKLRLCFDPVCDESSSRGQVTCYFIPAHRRAQQVQRFQPAEIGRWTFDVNGKTDLDCLDDGPFDMTAPKEAVAIVVGLILAAYSAPARFRAQQS